MIVVYFNIRPFSNPESSCSTSAIPGKQYIEDIPDQTVTIGEVLNVTCLPRHTFSNNDTSREIYCKQITQGLDGLDSLIGTWNLEADDVCKGKC